MVNYPATAAALLVVVLFGAALFALSAGRFTAAGVSFFSASLVIYFRESRLV
jgi:uncharacterized membrane protein